jgi:hypothetical protein
VLPKSWSTTFPQELPQRRLERDSGISKVAACWTLVKAFPNAGAEMMTDDQIAILGCFAAMAVCGLIAAVCFHFGPAGKSATPGHPSIPLKPATKAGRLQSNNRRAA